MFKLQLKLRPILPKVDDKGDLYTPIAVDQFAGQDFMVNQFGWLASDISLLVKANDQNTRDSLMSRLQVIKTQFNDNRSFREMIDTLVPRYCQTFAERSAFMDFVHQQHAEWFDDIDRDKLDTEPKHLDDKVIDPVSDK